MRDHWGAEPAGTDLCDGRPEPPDGAGSCEELAGALLGLELGEPLQLHHLR